MATGENPLIDDFEDGDQLSLVHDGRNAGWYFYNDETTGTQDVSVVADPTGERGIVLSVKGEGFAEWGSGFGVSMNWAEGQCTYDASIYDGVQFWARGSGNPRVTLQNISVRPVADGGECPADASCFDSHGVALTLTDEWTFVKLPFTSFVQAGWGTPVGPLLPEAIYLMEFQFPALDTFDVSLDDVSFYRAGEPGDAGVPDDASVPDASAGDESDTSDVAGGQDAAVVTAE